MNGSLPHRALLSASMLATALAAVVASFAAAAYAVPTIPGSITTTAVVPIDYLGTAATADLTDYETTISLPQVNPGNDATITSIVVRLQGDVFGDFSATNPTTTRLYRNQTADVSARITVTSPDPSGTTLGLVVPLVARTFDLAPGQPLSMTGLSGSDTNTVTTDASNPIFNDVAAYFLGTGTVALPVVATSNSKWSGSGNIRFAADTSAGARATVTVNYLVDAPSPPPPGTGSGLDTLIPEPASVAVLGSGLVATGVLMRRRRRAA